MIIQCQNRCGQVNHKFHPFTAVMSVSDKQKYLFQIIESNHDPEEFQEFMETKKGLDLEVYTLDELKHMVGLFKGKIQQESFPEHRQREYEESRVSEMPSELPSELGPREEQERIAMDFADQEEIEMSLKRSTKSFNSSTKNYYHLTKKQTLPQLYDLCFNKQEKVKVKVPSHSKSEEGWFSSSFVLYQIDTTPCGWSVKRRFNDFNWLHDKLVALYPGLPIPPIPKKTKMRSFDDQHIQQRMLTFQYFLNRLLVIPEICSDSIMQEFLRVPHGKQFELAQQKCQARLNNRGKKIECLKGPQTVDMSHFAVDTKAYSFERKTQQMLQKVNQLTSSFQQSLGQTINKAYELSSLMKDVFRHLQTRQSQKGGQIWEVLGEFMSQLGYNLDNQYFFIKNHIQAHWNYEQKYLGNLLRDMSHLHKEQEEVLQQFKRNPQQELQNQDISSTNKQLQQYLSNRQIFRIRLSFLDSQVTRHEGEDCLRYAREWVDAFGRYMDGVKDQMLSGADQLTRAICVTQGRKLIEVEYMNRKQERYSKNFEQQNQ